MERESYFAGQEVLREDISWHQTAKEEAIKKRLGDLWNLPGIVDVEGICVFYISPNADHPWNFDIGFGIGYNESGERIEISQNEAYCSDNPSKTTVDGVCIPQSTGNLDIPLYTYADSVPNYIWLHYFETANPSVFRLHKDLGVKYATEIHDGYEVLVNDVSGGGAIAGSIYLGSVLPNGACGSLAGLFDESGRQYVQIQTPQIADNSLPTSKYRDRSIIAEKIAIDGICTLNLIDSIITTPKVRDGAITPPKIDSTRQYEMAGLSTGGGFLRWDLLTKALSGTSPDGLCYNYAASKMRGASVVGRHITSPGSFDDDTDAEFNAGTLNQVVVGGNAVKLHLDSWSITDNWDGNIYNINVAYNKSGTAYTDGDWSTYTEISGGGGYPPVPGGGIWAVDLGSSYQINELRYKLQVVGHSGSAVLEASNDNSTWITTSVSDLEVDNTQHILNFVPLNCRYWRIRLWASDWLGWAVSRCYELQLYPVTDYHLLSDGDVYLDQTRQDSPSRSVNLAYNKIGGIYTYGGLQNPYWYLVSNTTAFTDGNWSTYAACGFGMFGGDDAFSVDLGSSQLINKMMYKLEFMPYAGFKVESLGANLEGSNNGSNWAFIGSLNIDNTQHTLTFATCNYRYWRIHVSETGYSMALGANFSYIKCYELQLYEAGYWPSGYYISPSKNTTYTNTVWGRLIWSADLNGQILKFQVATNNDNATWSFRGPDGSTSTYYTASGQRIWTGNDGNKYIKVKAYFWSTPSQTPILHSFTVYYSANGDIYSPIHDTSVVNPVWDICTTNIDKPAGTDIMLYSRTSTDGATNWSTWQVIGTGGIILSPSRQYTQWWAHLITTDGEKTPTLYSIIVAWYSTGAIYARQEESGEGWMYLKFIDGINCNIHYDDTYYLSGDEAQIAVFSEL